MKIRRFKILKDSIEVEYQEQKPDGTPKKVKEEHQTKPHADLLQSYENLRVHFALLTGYIGIKQVKKIETPPEELIESFSVHSISVKSGDDPGVVITGQKTLEDGKKVTVNTPFTRFGESDEAKGYRYIDDLIDKIDRANQEQTAYLDGSKKGDDPQQTLPFAGDMTGKPQNRDVEDAILVDDESDTANVWKDGERPA